LRLLLSAGDALGMALSLFAAIAFGFAGSGFAPHVPVLSFGLLVATWLTSAAVFDCYDLRVAARVRDSLPAAARALFATSLVYFTVQLVIPELIPPLGRNLTGVAAWFAIALVAISVARIAYVRLIAQAAERRRVALVGTPECERAASGLLKTIESEYNVVGLVLRDNAGSASADGLRVLGSHAELARIVSDEVIDEVIVADAGEDPATMDALIGSYESGVIVRTLSDVFEEVTGRIPVQYLRPHWFAVLPRRPGGGRLYDRARRVLDVLVAGAALLLLAPVLAALACAIWLDSPG